MRRRVILRRETIIALRARHTAFRIAIDILHPRQSPPPPMPPQPAALAQEEMDRAQAEWDLDARRAATSEREYRRALLLQITVIVVGLIAFIVFLMYVDEYHPSPPPSPVAPSAAPMPSQRP
jgi:hypothetical protein